MSTTFRGAQNIQDLEGKNGILGEEPECVDLRSRFAKCVHHVSPSATLLVRTWRARAPPTPRSRARRPQATSLLVFTTHLARYTSSVLERSPGLGSARQHTANSRRRCVAPAASLMPSGRILERFSSALPTPNLLFFSFFIWTTSPLRFGVCVCVAAQNDWTKSTTFPTSARLKKKCVCS